MIETTILYKDLSKTPEELRAMSYTERVEHDMCILYGARNSVGHIVTQASLESLNTFAENHVDEYLALAEQAIANLDGHEVYAPSDEISPELNEFLLEQEITIPRQRQSDTVTA